MRKEKLRKVELCFITGCLVKIHVPKRPIVFSISKRKMKKRFLSAFLILNLENRVFFCRLEKYITQQTSKFFLLQMNIN